LLGRRQRYARRVVEADVIIVVVLVEGSLGHFFVRLRLFLGLRFALAPFFSGCVFLEKEPVVGKIVQ
jgi:hypothetical protein